MLNYRLQLHLSFHNLFFFFDRVERIFREINSSILEGSLVITLVLKKLPLVLSRFTALTGLLVIFVEIQLIFSFGIKNTLYSHLFFLLFLVEI